MENLIQYLREKLINVYMVILGILITISAVLGWYNKQVLISTATSKLQAEQVKYLFEGIFERTLRSIDLGIRGYALTKNQQLLGPYESAVKEFPINMIKIDSLLTLQNQDTSIAKFSKIKLVLNDYIDVATQMKKAITGGNQEEFTRLLTLDKGYDAWLAFSPFFRNINAFEDNIINTASQDYQDAMNRNLIVQVILFISGVSILLIIYGRLRKQRKQREEIFNTLKESSDQFLFNPGKDDKKEDQSAIISQTIQHFKKASAFISSIAQGDYSIKWDGLDGSNEGINQETLAGQLHKMKNQLVKYRAEEEQRNWTNVGLAQYSEVVRKFQDNSESLCFESVRFITKYLKAQQGGLFVLAQEGDEKFLKLASAFAFDKKKYVEKKIGIGVGLVGQTFLEGETVKMKKVPNGYTHITSGLGDATPSCLVIVPLKHNEQVVAVIEIAGFQEFTKEQIDFIENCGEFLAAALFNAQTNDQIKKLLQDTQIQAENMRAQEEEMRQNMEELSATQEEMARKEQEYIAKIERLESEVAHS